MVFWEYESEMLCVLLVYNVIIIIGGGIIEWVENCKWMKENGIVVYLYCDLYVIVERFCEDMICLLF